MSLCIDNCEATAGWAGSTDVANIAVNADHRGPGVNSIEFDKTGATQAFAQIAKTVTSVNGSAYATHGLVEYYLGISGAGDLGRITAVYMALGTDNGNLWYWQTPVADLAVGWNHIHHPLSGVDGDLGAGANMGAITYVMFYVFLSAVGDTLTDMRIDDIRLRFTDTVSLADIHGSGNDGIMEVVQDTHDDLLCNATMQIADADLAFGEAAMAASLPVVIANNQTAVPVSDGAGSLTVDQATHGNLNANANIQVSDVDVGAANPVPVMSMGPFTAVLGNVSDLAASTMYQLIDLSDDTNFPHTATGAIVLKRLRFHEEKKTDGRFIVYVGVVTENDGTDGTADWLHAFIVEADGNPTDGTDRFAQELEFNLNLEVDTGVLVNYVTNLQLADNALLKNDVARTSPVGSANPAAGDLMVYVHETSDGGTINFTISADYNTVA